jgi:Domain of unknown function (DU1801)
MTTKSKASSVSAKKKTPAKYVVVKPCDTDKRPKSVPKKLKPANNKTIATKSSVDAFVASVPDDQREDTLALIELMRSVTGQPAEMWGAAIVGFGHRTLIYESGRTMDWMWVAFAPRKQNFSIMIPDGFPKYANLLTKLGKHTTGKSCLYVKKLADVDMNVLRELVTRSVKAAQVSM